MNKFNYNIILGCPRSGTTFLLAALEAFPQSEALSGDHLPVTIPHIVNNGISEEVTRALEFGFEHSLLNYLDRVTNSKFHLLHKRYKASITTSELIAGLQGKRLVKSILYKEPFLAFAPEFSYNSLPGCKIVHIIRDGRDCANSMVKSYDTLTNERLKDLRTAEVPIGRKFKDIYIPWWIAEGKDQEFYISSAYVRSIWMWKEMVRRCYDFFEKKEVKESGRVMVLRYEDLMTDPLHWGGKVIEHFGGTMTAQLKNKFLHANLESFGKYKRRDKDEIKKAEEIAGEELKLYNYL
jgi:hypothetical protein